MRAGGTTRRQHENTLFDLYAYMVGEGVKKYGLDREDASSAYADAVMAAVDNVVNEHFAFNASLKTYLYQIFSNKCVDLTRKKTTNKSKVHQYLWIDEMPLPDESRNILKKLMDSDLLDAVKKKIELLGEKCKEMLALWGDGYSDQEVSVMLDYKSEAVTKTSRLRCLHKLRELCKSEE